MREKMTKYIIIFFVLSLVSCQDKAKTKMLDEIDAMHSSLDSLEIVADENRIDTLTFLIEYIKSNTSQVKKNYYSDTVDYEIADMMNTYKSTRKAFAKNSGNLAKARQAIPEVKESLDNLAHDIKNGVGQREKYEEFVGFEREKLNQIKEILTYYMETKEKYTTLFIETDKKVLQFIEQLKSEK
jgi:hypothetical protein